MSKKTKDELNELLQNPAIKAEIDSEYEEFVASEEDIQEIIDSIPVPTIDKPPVDTTDGRGKKDSKEIVKVELEDLDLDKYLPAEIVDYDTAEDEDFKESRNNLYGIMGQTMRSLNALTQIAEQSQSPRAFEVIALLSKTLTDANTALMDMHSKKVKRDKDRLITQIKAEENNAGEKGNTYNTQNNIVIGTTADVDEAIRAAVDAKLAQATVIDVTEVKEEEDAED